MFKNSGQNATGSSGAAAIINGGSFQDAEFNGQYHMNQQANNVLNHQVSPQSNTTNQSSSPPVTFPNQFEAANQAAGHGNLEANQYHSSNWYNNSADTRFASKFVYIVRKAISLSCKQKAKIR